MSRKYGISLCKLGSKENCDFLAPMTVEHMFPHVSALAIKEGFYDQLEEMQEKIYFFVGGFDGFRIDRNQSLNYSDQFP